MNKILMKFARSRFLKGKESCIDLKFCEDVNTHNRVTQ